MSKKLFLFFLTFNLTALIDSISACTCIDNPLREKIKSATAIFECKTISYELFKIRLQLQENGDSISWPKVRYTCVVLNRWKGLVPDTIEVISNSGSTACGVDLEKDSTYILSVHKPSELEPYSASICGIYSLKSQGKRILDSLNYYLLRNKLHK